MKFRVIVFYLLVFSCGVSYAQEDSLRNVINKAANAEQKVAAINQLAWLLTRSDLGLSDSLARQALDIARENSLKSDIAMATNTLAVLDIMNGRYETALEKLHVCLTINTENGHTKGALDNRMNIALVYYFSGSLDTAALLLEKTADEAEALSEPRVAAKALSNLGAVYQNMGNYENGIKASLKCLEIATEMDDKALYSSTSGNIGLLYDYLKNYDKALQYHRMSLEIDSAMGDVAGLAYSYGNIGEIYRQMNDWEQAKNYYQRSYDAHQTLGDSGGIAGILLNQALVEEHFGKHTMAAQLIQTALTISLRNDFPYQSALAHHQLGSVNTSLANYPKALTHLRLSLDMSLSQNIADLIVGNYQEIATVFEKSGKPDSALFYLKKYHAYSDSIKQENITKNIDMLETKHRVLEKETQIAQLNEQQARASLVISRQRGWLVGIIFGSLMLIAVSAVIVVQRRRKAEALLAVKELEFGNTLLEATVTAQEEERQRIAKDLHDGLVQTLAAIKMGFQSVQRKLTLDPDIEDAYRDKVNLIDEAANEAREISHQMMPKTLLEVGLAPALEEMLQKTLGQGDIAYRYDAYAMQGVRFPKAVEIGLYRIAQELVNNIVKHSAATHVDIQLYKTTKLLILHVEDNGKGIRTTTPSKTGIGLHNIHSRARAVNGEVEYDESVPQGTVANVRIPIAA